MLTQEWPEEGVKPMQANQRVQAPTRTRYILSLCADPNWPSEGLVPRPDVLEIELVNDWGRASRSRPGPERSTRRRAGTGTTRSRLRRSSRRLASGTPWLGASGDCETRCSWEFRSEWSCTETTATSSPEPPRTPVRVNDPAEGVLRPARIWVFQF